MRTKKRIVRIFFYRNCSHCGYHNVFIVKLEENKEKRKPVVCRFCGNMLVEEVQRVERER